MTTTDPLTRSILGPAHAPGVVTNPAQIEAIRLRRQYAGLHWYQRVLRKTPPGWGRS